MSRNFGMTMLTMTNLSTECLLQLTKLGYDAIQFNQKLKQNAKREMRLRLGKVTVADVLAVYFFQAEDGIRVLTVTGVQTCALPISPNPPPPHRPPITVAPDPPAKPCSIAPAATAPGTVASRAGPFSPACASRTGAIKRRGPATASGGPTRPGRRASHPCGRPGA